MKLKLYTSSVLISKRLCTDISTRNFWLPVIGLEIHAQIKANTKLFSSSGTDFGVPPNSQVSFFDASLPGTLPVLNKKCVEEAVKTALALKSKVNKYSTFDRKHYFYADLPTGYQITQQRNPIAKGGYLKYLNKSINKFGKHKWIEKQADLVQIQLEQDSGKSMHDLQAGMSLIDLNRAGVGLMEIITHPHFSSASDAVAFVKELQLLLQTIDSCEAKMEEGGLRVDASVSVHKPNKPLGIRTEIKNLNSLRSLSKAIDFEIERQIKKLEAGGEITNDTLSFNVETGETVVMRDKQESHDYRFMPEPNLPPLILHSTQNQTFHEYEYHEEDGSSGDDQVVDVDLIASQLPELPHQCRDRLISTFGLTVDQAFILVSAPNLLVCFERCVADNTTNARAAANFFINEMLSVLNDANIGLETSPVTSTHISDILNLLENKTISLLTAKEVFRKLVQNPDLNINKIIRDEGWILISDDNLLRSICSEVIRNNAEAVISLKTGKKKTLNFLIGLVQKETRGQANGQKITQIFNELIK